MKTTHRTTLVVVGAAILTSLLACTSTGSFAFGLRRGSNDASEIADFDMPDGYRSDFTASLLGYTVAAFDPGDGHSHQYLIQSDDQADAHTLEIMLSELTPGTRGHKTRMVVIETRPAMVGGQEVTLVISEGVDAEGIPFRQVTTAFQGKGGPALLVFSEPVERWNQDTVDAFLSSVH